MCPEHARGAQPVSHPQGIGARIDGEPTAGGQDIDCRELVELVTTYLDGALDAQMRQRLEEHLLDCGGCRAYLEQFRITIATIARTADPPCDAVRDRLPAR